MPTSTGAQLSAGLPRRMNLVVPIPGDLSAKAIQDTVAVAASRLHWELSALYRRQRYERAEAQIVARRAERRTR